MVQSKRIENVEEIPEVRKLEKTKEPDCDFCDVQCEVSKMEEETMKKTCDLNCFIYTKLLY